MMESEKKGSMTMNTRRIKGENQRKAIAFVLIVVLMVGGLITPIVSMAGNADSQNSIKVTYKISDKKSEDIEIAVPINDDGTAKLTNELIPEDPKNTGDAEFKGWNNISAATEEERNALWSKNDLNGYALLEDTDFQAVYEEKEAENIESDAKIPTIEEEDSKDSEVVEEPMNKGSKKSGNVGTQASDELVLSWGEKNNPVTQTTIKEEASKSLSLYIPAESTATTGTRTLEITYTHKNTDIYSTVATDTGFSLVDYTKQSELPNLISGTPTIDDKTNTIKYPLNKNTYASSKLILTFFAGKGMVYNDEQLEVNAKIVENDGTKDETKYTSTPVNAIAEQGSYNLTPSIKLSDPTQMKNGEGEGRFYISYANDYRVPHTNKLTYDFANVKIRSGNTTLTYREWLDTGNSPITFYYEGVAITGSSLTASISNDVARAFFNSMMYFDYKTTSDFSNGAVLLTGKNLIADYKYRQNGRGPELTAYQRSSSTDVAPNNSGLYFYLANNFVAIDDDLIPGILSIPNIQPNSEYYKDHDPSYLYEAPLFLAYIDSTRTKNSAVGKEDVIKYKIPDGMSITKIILPENNCNYDSVQVSGNPTISQEKNLYFSPALTGEVTMTFSGLQYISYAPYAKHNLHDDTKIQFIGTTSNLTGKNVVTSVNGAVKDTSALDVYDDGKVVADPDVRIGDNFLRKGDSVNSTLGGSVRKGESFIIQAGVRPTSYPYSSSYFDNIDSYYSPIFAAPVVYIDVPGGMAIEGVSLSGYSSSRYKATYEEFDGGKWASSGGKIIEIKISNTDNSKAILDNEEFLYANLKLKIPANYNESQYGNSFTFTTDDLKWGSYDENTMKYGTNGSCGRVIDYSEFPAGGIANVKDKAIIHPYKVTNTFEIAMPDSATVEGSVKVGNEYKTYIPGQESTLPKRPAGSKNEEFQMYVGYGMTDPVASPEAYFIVPQGDGWSPKLNDTPTVNMSGISESAVTYYYTTDNVSSDAAIGDMAGKSWNKFDPATINKTTLKDVTAIKYVFDELTKGDRFYMNMPFEIPEVTSTSTIKYNDVAQGKTLYKFGATDGIGGRPAVQAVQTDPPMVRELTQTGDIGISSTNAITVNYGEALPNWYEVATYDDFTQGIKLSEININYTEQGKQTSTDKAITTFTTAEYTPSTSGGIDYKKGYSNTVANPTDFVDSTKPGTYEITYKSTADGDNQTGIAKRTIIVVKNTANSLKASPSSIDFFYDQQPNDVSGGATSWDKLYRSNINISDKGLTPNNVNANDATNDVELVSFYSSANPTVNIKDEPNVFTDSANTPGVYTLTYRYTDKFNNFIDGRIVVTVKYRGNIDAQVKMGTSPVSGASITGKQTKSTGADGSTSFHYEASVTTPAYVGYFLNLNSVPYGYKMPELTTRGGVLAKGVNTPEVYQVSPVSIKAEFQGNNMEDYMQSIALYDSKGVKIKEANINNKEASYTFYPEAGQVFSGDYYMIATLKPGYSVTSTSQFQQNAANEIRVSTGAIKNDDITKRLAVSLEEYDVVFKAGTGGTLEGTTDTITMSGINYGTKWEDAISNSTLKRVPTPVQNTNYYFAGWSPNLPKNSDEITGPAVYTATFEAKPTLTFTVIDNKNVTYNGKEQKATSRVQMTGTLIAKLNHTYKNDITASASGIDAKNYEITFGAVKKANFNNMTEDPTYYYNINYVGANFEITKRAITVKPVDVMTTYTGLAISPSAVELAAGSQSLGDGDKFDLSAVKFTGVLTDAGIATSRAVDVKIQKNGDADSTGNYTISYEPGKLQIYAANGLGVTATPVAVTYDDKAHGLDAVHCTVAKSTIYYSTNGGVSYTTKAPLFTEAGRHNILIKAENKPNYIDSAIYSTYVDIAQKKLTVKAASDSREYIPGQTLKSTSVSSVGLVTGHSLDFDVAKIKGSITNVGSVDATIDPSDIGVTSNGDAKTSNYDIDTQKGTLTILLNTTDLRVKAAGSTTMYDGALHGLTSATGTINNTDDPTATVVYSTSENGTYSQTMPTFTDVGTHKIWVKAQKTNYKDTDAISQDVKITERPITITANGKTKIYDGKNMKADSNTIGGQGLAPSEKIDVSYSGNLTNVGSATAKIANYTIKSGSKDTTKNYSVTTKTGNLKVDVRPVTIIPNDESKTFDGAPLKATSVKVSSNSKYGMLSGDKLTNPTFDKSISNVGQTKVKVLSVKVNGKTNNNYSFDSEEGTLTVTGTVGGQTSVPRGQPTGTDTTFNPSNSGTVQGSESAPTNQNAPIQETAINENTVPLIGQDGNGWALLNLILTIAGLVLAAMISIMAIYRKVKDDDEIKYNETYDEYYEEHKRSSLILIIGAIVLSLAGLVLFIFTEDMSKQMVLMDIWTVFNAIIFAAEVIAAAFAFRTKRNELDNREIRF